MTPIAAQAKVQGWFRMRVLRPDGSVRLRTPWFKNLITNGGLDNYWYGTFAPFGIKEMNNGCYVGTGSATPTYADSSLQAYLASGGLYADLVGTVQLATYEYSRRRYRFATGVAAGNLSEVAVGESSTRIFCRTLIKDSFGNPTTITVLSDEVLDVDYELRVYTKSLPDVVQTFVFNGVSQNVTVQHGAGGEPFGPIQQNTSTRSLPGLIVYPLTGEYGGNGGSNEGTGFITPYVAGSYELNLTSGWGINKGNGTSYFIGVSMPWGYFRFVLGTPITKTNVQTMQIGFKLSWSRYP